MNSQSILKKMLRTKILTEEKFFPKLLKEKLIKNLQIIFKKKFFYYNSLKINQVVISHFLNDFEFFLLRTNSKIKIRKEFFRNTLVEKKKNSNLLAIFLIFFSESRKISSLQRLIKKLFTKNYYKELIRSELIFLKKIWLCFKKDAKKNLIKHTINLIFKKIFSFVFMKQFIRLHIFIQVIYKETYYCEAFSAVLFLLIFLQKKQNIGNIFLNFIQYNKNFFFCYPTSSSIKNNLYLYSYMSVDDMRSIVYELSFKLDIYSIILSYEKRNQNQLSIIHKYSF